jgi:hypothetical protein
MIPELCAGSDGHLPAYAAEWTHHRIGVDFSLRVDNRQRVDCHGESLSKVRVSSLTRVEWV